MTKREKGERGDSRKRREKRKRKRGERQRGGGDEREERESFSRSPSQILYPSLNRSLKFTLSSCRLFAFIFNYPLLPHDYGNWGRELQCLLSAHPSFELLEWSTNRVVNATLLILGWGHFTENFCWEINDHWFKVSPFIVHVKQNHSTVNRNLAFN